MLIGDFNCEPSDPILDKFLKENSLHCHIKTKTCFKKDEGSCIDAPGPLRQNRVRGRAAGQGPFFTL